MIDHIGVGVRDFPRAKAFYEKALAPLGYKLLMDIPADATGGPPAAGFGKERPDFWIGASGSTAAAHIAFQADSHAVVDAFHKAALAAGGIDNGPPGIRAHYHPDYYGAFVLDPEGHNVEAVCHKPA